MVEIIELIDSSIHRDRLYIVNLVSVIVSANHRRKINKFFK